MPVISLTSKTSPKHITVDMFCFKSRITFGIIVLHEGMRQGISCPPSCLFKPNSKLPTPTLLHTYTIRPKNTNMERSVNFPTTSRAVAVLGLFFGLVLVAE